MFSRREIKGVSSFRRGLPPDGEGRNGAFKKNRIQNTFHMSQATKVSPDGEYLLSVGTGCCGTFLAHSPPVS